MPGPVRGAAGDFAEERDSQGEGCGATFQRQGDADLRPVMNTASMVGFGAVIAALPAFAGIREALVAIPGGRSS